MWPVLHEEPTDALHSQPCAPQHQLTLARVCMLAAAHAALGLTAS